MCVGVWFVFVVAWGCLCWLVAVGCTELLLCCCCVDACLPLMFGVAMCWWFVFVVNCGRILLSGGVSGLLDDFDGVSRFIGVCCCWLLLVVLLCWLLCDVDCGC